MRREKIATITLNVPNELIRFLEDEAKRTGSTKDKISEAALNKYWEALEDAEDIADAEQVLADIKSGKEKTYTLAEVEKELGL